MGLVHSAQEQQPLNGKRKYLFTQTTDFLGIEMERLLLPKMNHQKQSEKFAIWPPVFISSDIKVECDPRVGTRTIVAKRDIKRYTLITKALPMLSFKFHLRDGHMTTLEERLEEAGKEISVLSMVKKMLETILGLETVMNDAEEKGDEKVTQIKETTDKLIHSIQLLIRCPSIDKKKKISAQESVERIGMILHQMETLYPRSPLEYLQRMMHIDDYKNKTPAEILKIVEEDILPNEALRFSFKIASNCYVYQDGLYLYYLASYLDHQCGLSNCVMVSEEQVHVNNDTTSIAPDENGTAGTNPIKLVIATEDIKKGTALNNSYHILPFNSVEKRRQILRTNDLFTCTCKFCSTSSPTRLDALDMAINVKNSYCHWCGNGLDLGGFTHPITQKDLQLIRHHCSTCKDDLTYCSKTCQLDDLKQHHVSCRQE